MDLVVVDGIRFVLSGGIYTALFIPACAPVCAMAVVLCSTKENNLIEQIRHAYLICATCERKLIFC